jgi:hypothetical protein
MAKPKKKLTPAQRAERKRRKLEFMTIFINGKQKRVRRPPTIDGMDAEEFIRQNADSIWLHQNERWDILHEREMEEQSTSCQAPAPKARKSGINDDSDDSDDLPF